MHPTPHTFQLAIIHQKNYVRQQGAGKKIWSILFNKREVAKKQSIWSILFNKREVAKKQSIRE
jgi:hypothetical protein